MRDGRPVTVLLGHSFGRTPFGVHAVAAAAQRREQMTLADELNACRKHLDNIEHHVYETGRSVDGGEQT